MELVSWEYPDITSASNVRLEGWTVVGDSFLFSSSFACQMSVSLLTVEFHILLFKLNTAGWHSCEIQNLGSTGKI